MGCQDEMVEMGSQGGMEKGETLVCRDYLAHVYKLSIYASQHHRDVYMLAINSYSV